MIDESRVVTETVPVRQGYVRWSETYDTQDNALRAKEYWTGFRNDFDLGWPMLLLMKLGKLPTGPAQGGRTT